MPSHAGTVQSANAFASMKVLQDLAGCRIDPANIRGVLFDGGRVTITLADGREIATRETTFRLYVQCVRAVWGQGAAGMLRLTRSGVSGYFALWGGVAR